MTQSGYMFSQLFSVHRHVIIDFIGQGWAQSEILVLRANNRYRWSQRHGLLQHPTQAGHEARCVVGPSTCSGRCKADSSHLWPRPNACFSISDAGSSNFMFQTPGEGEGFLKPLFTSYPPNTAFSSGIYPEGQKSRAIFTVWVQFSALQVQCWHIRA